MQMSKMRTADPFEVEADYRPAYRNKQGGWRNPAVASHVTALVCDRNGDGDLSLLEFSGTLRESMQKLLSATELRSADCALITSTAARPTLAHEGSKAISGLMRIATGLEVYFMERILAARDGGITKDADDIPAYMSRAVDACLASPNDGNACVPHMIDGLWRV